MSKTEHIVKVLSVESVTHDVKRYKVERPAGYDFVPGQATEVSINSTDWKNETRPFTFTGLAGWDHLEFTIKLYSDHNGVTNKLGEIRSGDELILHEVFGTITYQGEGTFIAGGAGVTPFIAILRLLHQENKLGQNSLIFSNKTENDIILKDEFSEMLGARFINTLTNDSSPSFYNRMIDKDFLLEVIDNFSQYFYICGPDPMVEAVKGYLLELGTPKRNIIIEQF